ncbi:MAG TPA: nucleotidyltransferase domain-containing protein [Methylomusa anaerophila]|uniref:Nucleotidyltransferase domain protein n=1 Tax=Methylomusa anaerophila TaxID=1930071 RepID=A0A348AG18_9FIRM|nr:nucleotidyltransferase domain-containing protein [Methylomusa anaerophila]BBB90016.1 nucleotidyltransferase domain protein [Methylomusa anaerophila]HML88255.1 nucleotidyltransferase domain-containing protein [Methylomusa anaerophila]
MKYGLTEKHLQEIISILKKYPKVTEAFIFGSRAMGNYKQGSDVDIALKGEVSTSDAATIKDDLEEETFLPFFFDVVAYNRINNQSLKEHIDTHGVKFYTNEEFTSIND